EFVGGLRTGGVVGYDDRKRRGGDGLSDGLAGRDFAHQGPIVFPADGLHVNDAAVSAAGLKVQEPAFMVRSFDVAALVRAVDGGAALLKDDAVFVGAVDILGTEHGLSAAGDAA